MAESVLITGASSDMGLKTAVLLAERGYQVYATMRDLGHREALDAEAARRNVHLEVLRLDVTDPQTIREAVDTVVEETGAIYGLANFAGVELRGFLEDLADDEVRHLFETNVFGTMAVTRAVLPYMRAARKGRIIVMSSVAGRIGAMGLSAYCAARFAQEGFIESLYQEVKPLGIHVSLIEPGMVKTGHWASANHAIARQARSPDSPYHPWLQTLERLTQGLVESSPTTTADVADAAYRALTARQPRLRYMVGRRARLVVGLRRYLPADLFERLYFGTIIRRVTQPGRE